MPSDDPTEVPIPEVLTTLARRVTQRGRRQFGKVAKVGRQQLELRQARADLDDFWSRMGKTAFRLNQAGEISHPALDRAQARIERLLQRIDELQTRPSDLDDED
ncbi:MAG: hypothetical protein EA397_14745 [Deltaproteobacteria bacterium]|nr:MAG: hypothetical protein EA397_14745 [Deltaproteobacteria bacterium]